MASESPTVVSSCPSCGAPIYAEVTGQSSVPRTVYSCDCRKQAKKNQSTGNSSNGMFKTG